MLKFLNLKRRQKIIFLSFCLFIFVNIQFVHSENRYIVVKEESHIPCWVKYFAVPKIKGEFQDFSGTIYFTPEQIDNSSVLIKIKTDSFKTQRPFWDRIIKSKRVLDSSQYPEVVFQSKMIEGSDNYYWVAGDLTLHGVTKKIVFPFYVKPMGKGNARYLKAEGKWEINRKDYDVIWHKLLDKGGVVVGNKVTIDWKIIAKID